MRELTIDGRRISDDTGCFVIAEIGHNHQGSVERARQLLVAARDCGVHAVKLQKRDNRSLYTRAQFDAPYDHENSFGPTYGAHREALELDRDAYVELQASARELVAMGMGPAFPVRMPSRALRAPRAHARRAGALQPRVPACAAP